MDREAMQKVVDAATKAGARLVTGDLGRIVIDDACAAGGGLIVRNVLALGLQILDVNFDRLVVAGANLKGARIGPGYSAKDSEVQPTNLDGSELVGVILTDSTITDCDLTNVTVVVDPDKLAGMRINDVLVSDMLAAIGQLAAVRKELADARLQLEAEAVARLVRLGIAASPDSVACN